jgi:galactose mutarotase-like enzyme
MPIFFIENDELKIAISSNGAELQSIFNKTNSTEYLWDANPNFWAKKSPILFPIVGGLKNNQYSFNGETFSLNRHGFAREKEFEVNQISKTRIHFILHSTQESLNNYPFHFKLTVEYSIINNQLFCKYVVENLGNDEMYFSIGAHPAFKVPLDKETKFDDWFLEFNSIENANIFPLTNEGLLETNSIPFFQNTKHLPLKKDLFYKDALVFKDLQSNKISLKSISSKRGLTMQFDDFNFFGIWSAKNADFVCLEPWCGVADSTNSTGDITKKEGINKLNSNEIFNRTWSIELF